ncbi:MAG TPA: hypothetical protein VJB63_01765 [Patescibacteria group bacterium]|nr:hypothetical protein [Patescibacteria group bacterium]
MLHIILGDDSRASRQRYIQLKDEYKKKEYDIVPLDSSSLLKMDQWLYQSIGLFASKKAFFGENLLSRKELRELLKKYDTKSTDINIFIWEELLEDRVVKYYFKNAHLSLSKLPQTIFKLLDTLYPSNKQQALTLLGVLSKNINEHMILVMMQKRIRELIVVQAGIKSEKKLASWQVARLKTQAGKWDEKKISSLYEALYRVEVLSKTSANYYSVKKALDIVLFYFL